MRMKGTACEKNAGPAQAEPGDESEGEKSIDAGDDDRKGKPDRITPETFPMMENEDENIDPRYDNETVDQAGLQGVAKKPRGENGAGRNRRS